MVLRVGENVHVITRRTFEGDLRRHFVGNVVDAQDGAFRVGGYAFVFEPRSNKFEKRPEQRTRIFSLVDAGIIISVLPARIKMEDLEYRVLPPNNRLVLTDGEFSLDINEFGSTR